MADIFNLEVHTHINPLTNEGDKKTIIKLNKMCFINDFKNNAKMSVDGYKIPDNVFLKTLLNGYENHDLLIVRNLANNEIIAFCFVQLIDATKLFIHSVCVSNKFKRRGLCKMMIGYIVEHCGEQFSIDLQVRIDKYQNRGLPLNPACYCYERFGFRIVKEGGCRVEYDGLNIRMTRPIDAIYTDELLTNTTFCNNRPDTIVVLITDSGVNYDTIIVKNLTRHSIEVDEIQIGDNILVYINDGDNWIFKQIPI